MSCEFEHICSICLVLLVEKVIQTYKTDKGKCNVSITAADMLRPEKANVVSVSLQAARWINNVSRNNYPIKASLQAISVVQTAQLASALNLPIRDNLT